MDDDRYTVKQLRYTVRQEPGANPVNVQHVVRQPDAPYTLCGQRREEVTHDPQRPGRPEVGCSWCRDRLHTLLTVT